MFDESKLQGAARDLPPAGLIAVAWVGLVLAASLVGLRLYVRITENRTLQSDDYCLITALVLLLVNAILQTLQTQSLYYMVKNRAGQVPGGQQLVDQGNDYVRYQFAIIGLFWTVLWSVKASFLALYSRFFRSKPRYRRAWWCTVVFTALAYIGCWIASAWVSLKSWVRAATDDWSFVQTCHPPSTYFQFGKCDKAIDDAGSVIAISYSTAVDVLSDILIILLPSGLLRHLQVDKRHKLGLAGIFGIGLVRIPCAIIRWTQIVLTARTDPVGLAVWSLAESSISVMIGSLPALKALFTRTVNRTVQRSYEGDVDRLNHQDLELDGPQARRTRLHRDAMLLEEQCWPESQERITHGSLETRDDNAAFSEALHKSEGFEPGHR
ncbi:hypothetical protein KC318_g1720 [Hortaea werneckii]|uniref:Rhodopsin domain-containing protein n=1 Tax=Hortaea werneckii TaxID=91943 RepID=A0A3M6ZXS6_HORWE|nr:hypothetical protein KC334_g1790 [Hortaea werneckii]KAI7023464.1 hypothetical protein KC355_g1707 [Hortaea werneckii]KAI7674226.1 hypothetical protein KC318_g1720 [Hortaea werneckii]RMY20116.1 hypothetical protein D0867_04230 [Hortaea werneckii]RMY35804.1 hypothetical protein D0866_04358 [Hortaea werneckii]